jgi:iron complex outermembrane recepter protein
LTPSVLLYGSVARGFKSGGWNADFITSVDKFNFAPEFALNYELGAKTSLWSNRLTINSALFVTKLDDFQVFQFLPTAGGGTLLSLTNAGKVTSQGVELDIGTSVTESLRFSVNAAFTQARFDEFKNGGGLGVNYDKNYLPYAPKLSYFLALDYSKAVGRELEIYANLNYGYKDNYFSNPNNSQENSIPHQYLINARIGLELGEDWDISLWAKNFTDETNLRQRSVSFLGVPRGYYDPPRSYGLSLSYSFD